MRAIDTIEKLIEQKNGLLLTSDAMQAGVSKTTLSNLVQKGQLERVAHGQYILPADLPDELFFWQQRVKNMIYSHETALFLHNMSERTPFRHSVTIPSNTKLSQAFPKDLKIYYIKPKLFELGVTSIPSIMGNPLKAYDMERTICDIIRSRNRIDSQIAAAAIRDYVSSPTKNFNKLGRYATEFRVTKVLRAYLEVLQ